MIIDCHGHYTTAPKALEAWRNQQIAGIKDPAVDAAGVSELKISDDELRETIETNQLRQMKARGIGPDDLQPARELHGPPHRRLPGVVDLGGDLQRAVLSASAGCSPTTSSRRRCCRRARASIRTPASPSWRSASRSTARRRST